MTTQLSEFWQMVLFAWVFFGIPAVPLTFALVMQWKQRGRRGKGRSLV